MLDAVESFKKNPVSEYDLKQAKERIRYSFSLSMDNPDAIANAVGLYTWLTGDPATINASYKIMDEVTAEDIQRVAKKYLVQNGMTIGTISPTDNPVLD